MRNPVNGESRGFGFVAMKYEEDVDAVRPLCYCVRRCGSIHALISHLGSGVNDMVLAGDPCAGWSRMAGAAAGR